MLEIFNIKSHFNLSINFTKTFLIKDLIKLTCKVFAYTISFRLTSVSTSDKRSLRPQRHHKTGVNPIKLLQQRDDLIDETTLVAAAKV